MKKIAVLLVFIISLSGFSMSDTTNTEPTVKESPKENSHKITQEELHNIAVNYYHYRFEEEHEFKGIRVDSSKSVIKDIFPYEENGVTFFYGINYSPDGQTYIPAYKFVSRPGFMGGGGKTNKIKSIDDKKSLPLPVMRGFHSIREKTLLGLQGKHELNDKKKLLWEKFNKPPNQFHEQRTYESSSYKPKWWLEKKNFKSSKNTEGMIQTEWNQYFPFNNDCPYHSAGKTLVGCTPLAISQLMKYYEWPLIGIGENSYTWFNGEILRTLEADFGATTYDWTNMPAYADSSSSQTEHDAVSTLCYHTGIALNAVYGVGSGTSAYADEIPHSITRYFNYTSQLMSEVAWYTNGLADWKDSLITSMENGKPVLYSAFWNNDDPGSHTWIVDQYYDIDDEFHFNLGWYHPDSIDMNIWYPADDYLKDRDKAIFNIIPDRTINALPIPYTEDFENTYTSTTIASSQIPKYIGIDENNYSTFPNIGYHNSKALTRIYVPDTEDSFIIKKINLACNSVPILRYKYRINDYQNIIEGDSLIIEVSKDNRLTWNKISKIDHLNHNSTSEYEDKIISLNNFKDEIVNIRYHFYSDTNTNASKQYEYYIDNIEVGELGLHFTDLEEDDILPPLNAQPIKVTPSIVTPPKSKGNEDCDMVMDFYIKEDTGGAVYNLMHSDSTLENGIFEYPNWNTNNSLGKAFFIRAVARTKSDITTLDSIEIRVEISGRKNFVSYPPPATESWFDFEKRLELVGGIMAEEAFADSIDNVLYGYDIYDDYYSELNGFALSIFHPQYQDYYGCDSTVYFCTFGKDGKQLEYRPDRTKELDHNIANTMKFIEPVKNSKESKDIYPTFYYRYPKSLDIYPGTYTVFLQAIRKDLYLANGTISEIAKHDSMQFIIPQWKMKIEKDYWIYDQVPYVPKKQFQKTKSMKLTIWRPVYLAPYHPLYLNMVRETDNEIVQSYEIDFNTKASYDDVEWTIPDSTEAGFYIVRSNNLDYYTDIEVAQEEITQVCPLYLSWEQGGAWPDNWPGGENTADWEIYNAPSSPVTGDYTLAANYNTDSPGKKTLERSETLKIEGQWDRVLEFALGLYKSTGDSNFDPLLANYSIATSKDGVNWTIEKTAKIEEYNIYSWGSTARYCFRKFYKPLGNVANLGLKFITNGTTTEPASTSQTVLFDEVKIDYTKEAAKPAPVNYQNFFADGNVTINWSAPPAAKEVKSFDTYYVYRNGIKIGQTTDLTYIDTSIETGKFYSYSVTAHYTDGSVMPESPMLDCSGSIYTGLESPSDLIITNEDPNIKLVWSAADGASSYKVYSSDDPYGTFAEDTSGTLNGTEWVAPLSQSKLFYYVVATDVSKENKKITKDKEYRVK